jgi:YVTN family beta-propeller protein
MSRPRVAGLIVSFCALAAMALPSAAAARLAYVTSSYASSGQVIPVELSTGAVGVPTPFSTEGPPPDVAIIPNGKTAYVPDGDDEVVPFDVATNTAGTPIETGPGTCPRAVATHPDGSRVYTVNLCNQSVSVIDVASGTEVAEIPLTGTFPWDIAVTPDGTRAYVTHVFEETVTPIDLLTNTAGTPIPVGEQPEGIAVTPDGSRAYVTLRLENAVKRITISNNAVGPAIPVGEFPGRIAITPDGGRAYVLGGDSPVTPIDLATDTPGTPIPVENHFLEDIATTPDGTRAWIPDANQLNGDRLVPIDIPGNTLGAPITGIERPEAIAIVPNQPPHAAFTATSPILRGDPMSFDAGGSTDTDGTVARYEWDFGDGGDPVVAGATPQHTYAFGGTYTVTLTTTDNEGCSLDLVFTGQTAHCNGSTVARTTRQVQVNPKCIQVNGDASSFVPKYRAARVVPGLRLRLSATDPARLTVDATMSWKRDGHSGTHKFDTLVTNVQHWRRVRFVMPSELRDTLPLGAKVKLKVQIQAAPLDETLCPANPVTKNLRLKVVKVIPGKVQAGRRK